MLIGRYYSLLRLKEVLTKGRSGVQRSEAWSRGTGQDGFGDVDGLGLDFKAGSGFTFETR